MRKKCVDVCVCVCVCACVLKECVLGRQRAEGGRVWKGRMAGGRALA